MIKTTQELQQHIRVITNNDFDNLRPSLKRAQRYITRIVGVNVWQAALNYYESDFYNNVHDTNYAPHVYDEDDDPPLPEGEDPPPYALLDKFVDRIQDALVHYAYWLWSPQANVILSDSGFQVAWTDNLRPAQEWQIDAAVQSIIDTAHEFVDDLIEFLDEHIEEFEFWAGSEEQAKSKELFINNARTLNNYININNSRRLFLELHPFINEAQLSYIIPLLGKEDTSALLEKQKDGDLTADDKELIRMIEAPLAYLTISQAITSLPIEIWPGSITEKVTGTQSNTRKAPARMEIMNAFAAEMKKLGELNLQRLKDFITEKTQDPENPEVPTAKPEPVVTSKSFSI